MKSTIRKIFAITMAISVVMMYSVTAFAADNGSQYEPNTFYTVGESQLVGLPAVEGYYWTKEKISDAKYDTTADPICGIEEHTHSQYAGDCYTQKKCDLEEHTHSQYAGECYTQKKCDIEEHTHSDSCKEKNLVCKREEHKHVWRSILAGGCGLVVPLCGKTEHTHGPNCYEEKIICNIPEHVHSSATPNDCQGWELTCTTSEHTHSDATANDCMGWELTCTTPEHSHVDTCYPLKEAQYKVMLLKSGSSEADNGNEWVTVRVKVACADGKTNAAGIKVNLVANDYTEGNASTPVLDNTAYTNESGIATFKFSSTYDKVTVTVNGKTIVSQDRIGWTVARWNVQYNSTLDEHIWRVDKNTATCTENGEEISVCKACGATKSEFAGKLGHDYIIAEQPESVTCTKDGKTALERCTRCQDEKGGEVVKALGHSYSKVSDEVEPTCTEDGKTALERCRRCQDEKGGEVLEALGHSWSEWEKVEMEPEGDNVSKTTKPLMMAGNLLPMALQTVYYVRDCDRCGAVEFYEDTEGTIDPIVTPPDEDEPSDDDIIGDASDNGDDSADADANGGSDMADDNVVNTGDSSEMIPWAVGLVSAILAVFGVFTLRRRENE